MNRNRNRNQNQTQTLENTRLYNITNFEINYPTYKALVNPISDLISVLYDITKNTNEYISGYNNSEQRLKLSLYTYFNITLQNRLNILYEILEDCVKSYNLYKQNLSQYNGELWEGEYPKLNIEDIDNNNLRSHLESIIIFFSLYYHPDENENRQRYTYIQDFQDVVYKFCEILINTPSEIGLSQQFLATIPNKISNSVILDIVSYSTNSNNYNNRRNNYNNNRNNYNNRRNNYNNNRNYNNQMNENQGNGLPNNNTHINIRNYNSTELNTKAVKQCFDPLMANNKNIINEDAVLYILNTQNKIIRTICIDEDSFNGILVNKDNLFYQCKPTVPQGALYIPPETVLPTRLRKIAIDIIMYVYENQAKQIQLGRKYILTPTNTPVGRIASYATVRGNSVVSAEHCQNNYTNDFIYDIQEYNEPMNGGKRKTRKPIKTRKPRKTRNHLKKTKRHLKKAK